MKNCKAQLLFLALSSLLMAQPLQAQSQTLFENALVINGLGAQFNADVLIESDIIVAVGDAADFDLSPDISRLDLAGKILIPAMIDAHAHLGYQSTSAWGADNYSRENLIANLRQYAYYGFAAVFSAGSDPEDLALALQAEQHSNAELVDSARFLFAAGMGPPGQGPNNQFLEQTAVVSEREGMTILRGLSSPQQAVLQVEEVAAKGIPFIKIWVDDRGGSQDKLSAGIYSALTGAANDLGIKVFVHQQYPADMLPLLDAGVSGFLHGRLGPALGEEIAAAMAEAGAFVVPNLGLGELRRETIGRDVFLQALLPADVAARLSEVSGQRSMAPAINTESEQDLRISMSHLLDAGADIVLGTDAGALPDHPFGYTGHRELEIFVRLGMSPMQALVAATGNAASRLGQDDLGVIETGRKASFIVLDANPLEDIRNTRSINAVYLNGRRVNRTAIAASLRND